MSTSKYSLLPILLTLLCLLSTACNDSNANNDAVISQSASIQGFVPEGWEVDERITGYIDHDSIEDIMLTIKKIESDNQDDTTQGNILLILIGQGNNVYKQIVRSNSLLPCSGCLGVMGVFGENSATILLENRVIIIGWFGGSRNSTEVALKFRFDVDSNKILLAQEEIIKSDRTIGVNSKTVTNYFQGYKINNGLKESILKRRIPIENVEFIQYQ